MRSAEHKVQYHALGHCGCQSKSGKALVVLKSIPSTSLCRILWKQKVNKQPHEIIASGAGDAPYMGSSVHDFNSCQSYQKRCVEEKMTMSTHKRKAEDDLQNEQRLAKRFDLLNLGRR